MPLVPSQKKKKKKHVFKQVSLNIPSGLPFISKQLHPTLMPLVEPVVLCQVGWYSQNCLSLVVQPPLEHAVSPQLTSCEEPPHTAPTAPTTCATHSAPESSEAPPSSSAQKHRLPQGQARRPRLTQARRPLLCQARWLSPSPPLKRGDYGGGHCGLQPQSALNCLHLQSAILIPR